MYEIFEQLLRERGITSYRVSKDNRYDNVQRLLSNRAEFFLQLLDRSHEDGGGNKQNNRRGAPSAKGKEQQEGRQNPTQNSFYIHVKAPLFYCVQIIGLLNIFQDLPLEIQLNVVYSCIRN